VTTNTTYLEYYISYILAVQEKYAPAGRTLPLCIMTSGDTHKRTMELLQAKNYYGMTPEQVTVVQQGEGVPALLDNDAKFATRSLDRWYEIVTKPHGHGDIHQLLYAHGVAKKWNQQGIEWLVLFQDTNGLAFHTLPVLLGVSAGMDLIMNSLTIPRKAKQAVGGIALLTNATTGEKRYDTASVHVHRQFDRSFCWNKVCEDDETKHHHITSEHS
jgi:UDP-sugar pyrophosphorylase